MKFSGPFGFAIGGALIFIVATVEMTVAQLPKKSRWPIMLFLMLLLESLGRDGRGDFGYLWLAKASFKKRLRATYTPFMAKPSCTAYPSFTEVLRLYNVVLFDKFTPGTVDDITCFNPSFC